MFVVFSVNHVACKDKQHSNLTGLSAAGQEPRFHGNIILSTNQQTVRRNIIFNQPMNKLWLHDSK